MINKNQFNAVTMPELRAEVVRLSSIVDYYRAENNHISGQSGRVLTRLIESALEVTLEDLNTLELSENSSDLLNRHHDQLNQAKGEIISICPSMEL